jgi:opacity protein-like surface antigen
MARVVVVRRRGARLAAAGFGALAGIAVLVGSAATAEDAPVGEPATLAADPEPSDWELTLDLYGWVPATAVTINAGDTTVDLDLSISNVVNDLEGGLMGAGEVLYRGRWILNVDLFGAQLGVGAKAGPYPVGFGPKTVTRGLRSVNVGLPVRTPIGDLEVPIRVDPGVLRVDVPRVETTIGPVEVDTTVLMLQTHAFLGYRLFDGSALELLGHESQDDRGRLRIDLLGGIRYWYMRTKVDVKSPPIEVPPFTVTSSVSGGSISSKGGRIPPQTVAIPSVQLPDVEFPGLSFGGTHIQETARTWWFDPVIGLRIGADLTEKIGLTVGGNVGGFGIGSASQFTWEAFLSLDYAITEQTSLGAGYRAIGLNRDNQDVQSDTVLKGPLIGLRHRF